MQLAEPFPDAVSTSHFVRRMVTRLWMPFSDTRVAPDQIHAFFSENMQQDGPVGVCLPPALNFSMRYKCSGNQPWITTCYQEDVENVPSGSTRKMCILASFSQCRQAMGGKLLPALECGRGSHLILASRKTPTCSWTSVDEIKRHHIITQVKVHNAFDTCSKKGRLQVRHGSTQGETFEII